MGILRQLYANTRENFRQSVAALRASPMRSVLTMAIVAIGITALMGMLTVIGAITHSLQSDLGARQGAAFRITSWASNMSVQGGRYTSGEDFRYISCREGASFAELYAPHGTVGLDVSVASIEARRGSYHTRPYLSVRGVNRDFFTVEQLDLEQGRCFSSYEERIGRPVVVLGKNIVETLFPNGESPLGKRVLLGSSPFTVIGVLKGTANRYGQNEGDRMLVPLRGGLSQFPRAEANCNISVRPAASSTLAQAKDAAERLMRKVRRLSPQKRSNFNITNNDEFLKLLLNSMGSTAVAGVLIGLITLLGSAVALMNIMLASVTERTREIGTRKAIGAHVSTIRQQFLIEAVLVTLVGGFAGVLLGVVVGSLVSNAMEMPFSMPWGWALGSLVLCVVVGIMAGYLPAKRAANLDPILALRYE